MVPNNFAFRKSSQAWSEATKVWRHRTESRGKHRRRIPGMIYRTALQNQTRDEHQQNRAFRPKAYATGDEKCLVFCYQLFVYRRPDAAKTPESPFFLAINHRRRPEDDVWFRDRDQTRERDFETEKCHTNTVAQLSAHKNSESLSGKTTSSNAAAFTEHKTNPFQASSSQQSQQG